MDKEIKYTLQYTQTFFTINQFDRVTYFVVLSKTQFIRTSIKSILCHYTIP